MLWMETSTPSLEEAKEFADAIHAKYPGELIASVTASVCMTSCFDRKPIRHLVVFNLLCVISHMCY